MDPLDFQLEAMECGLYDEPPPPPKIKGLCPHCGKIIGRGIWRHEQTCSKRPK